MTLKEMFKIDALNYLQGINQNNFESSYDGFIMIIMKYKNQGIAKSEIIEGIIEIDKLVSNDYQDEILINASNKLEGFCPPGKEIKWDY